MGLTYRLASNQRTYKTELLFFLDGDIMNNFEENLFDSLRDMTSHMEQIEETLEDIKKMIAHLCDTIRELEDA